MWQEHGAAVVTVGTINGGVRSNVVGGSCTMTGTLRAITDENRRLVRQRTEEIIKVHINNGNMGAVHCALHMHGRCDA
jgi:metal-dependent amidase/aminoacylase/carboxypeptidase family protein